MKSTILLLLLTLSCLASRSQLVVQVFDGDTYKVLDNNKLNTVRLANVDAPELNQYYGTIVKRGVSKLILGKQITMRVVGIDRYGRMLGIVCVGTLRLDSLLVANGWAWHYVPYSTNPLLTIYETAARIKKCGMWKCRKNIPPWVWRKLNHQQKRLKEMCR